MTRCLWLRRAALRGCLVLFGTALPCFGHATTPLEPIQGIGQLTLFWGSARAFTVPSDTSVEGCSHSGYTETIHGDFAGTVTFVPDGTGHATDWQGHAVTCAGISTYTPSPSSPIPWTARSSPGGVGARFSCVERLGNGNPIPREFWSSKGIEAPWPTLQDPERPAGTAGSVLFCACRQTANAWKRVWDAKLGYCVAKRERPLVLGFFNGVWNTEKQSQDGLQAIEKLIGPKHGDTELRYERFYNQTGSANGNTALQDIAEVFIQRGDELEKVLSERWELYWELLSGRAPMEGSLTHRLLSGFRLGATRLSDLVDAVLSRMLAGFAKGLAQMLSNPPTAADVAAHLTKLQGLADEDYAFALVAHSQGNLFVNVAYDGLKQTRPEAIASVVHVAPASPTLRGPHVLAEIDEVINGLRNFGPWTVPNINLWLRSRGGDPSGHTLVGTYLDGTRPARSHVQGMITHALDEVAPVGP